MTSTMTSTSTVRDAGLVRGRKALKLAQALLLRQYGSRLIGGCLAQHLKHKLDASGQIGFP
jgi:hypothetical protein